MVREKSKAEYYFVTCKNYVKFRFPCPYKKISPGHRHIIYLSIVCSCFGLTHADSRSCNRDHVVNKAKKIYCLDLYRRSLLTSVSKEHRNRLLPPQSSDTPSPIFSSSPPASEQDVALVLAKPHITDPHSLASSGTLTRQWCCCLLFQVILPPTVCSRNIRCLKVPPKHAFSAFLW